MATRIIPVIYADGQTVSASLLGGQPGAVAFEVFDGDHAGERGTDTALYDLVGPVYVDWSVISIYETGRRIGCNLCHRPAPAETRHAAPEVRPRSLAKCLDEAVGL